MRVLIIGGTGSMSSRITEKAFLRGHDVLVFSRGKRPLLGAPLAGPSERGVRVLQGERHDLGAHAAALAEFAPDVVVDSICFEPARARELAQFFPRVRRLVFVSTVDVYGEDIGASPVAEDRAPRPVTPYAKNKLASEEVVLEAFGARATVFRPSHILGRTFLTTSLWGRTPYLVSRLQQGKIIPAIDGGRNLMTPVYAADAAEWIVRSFDAPAADGQIINAVGGEIITQQHYYECIARALGVQLRLLPVPSQVFKRYIDAPTQFNWHRPYSCAKAVALLGYAPAGTAESMLRETVSFMLENGLVKDCSEQPYDDALIELLERHEAELAQILQARATFRAGS